MTDKPTSNLPLFISAGIMLVPLTLVAALIDETRLVGTRFLTGFARFLIRNVPAITPNAATWIPGLAAFGLAVMVVHLMLASPLRRRLGHWRVSHTFSLAMLVPLLFMTAFLVPGVLLHALPLAKAPWFDEH